MPLCDTVCHYQLKVLTQLPHPQLHESDVIPYTSDTRHYSHTGQLLLRHENQGRIQEFFIGRVQIKGGYPKTITFLNILGISFSGKMWLAFQQVKKWYTILSSKNFSLKQASGLIGSAGCPDPRTLSLDPPLKQDRPCVTGQRFAAPKVYRVTYRTCLCGILHGSVNAVHTRPECFLCRRNKLSSIVWTQCYTPPLKDGIFIFT